MKVWTVCLTVLMVGCVRSSSRPADVPIGQESCAQCRMIILSSATAGQIVAPGEEPRFFDEIGCLRDYLKVATLPRGAAIYVADHRTREWIDARVALFTRTTATTPMASGIIAHADAASKAADAIAAHGEDVSPAKIIGSSEMGPAR